MGKRGTIYGVGVGPGDPELITQKACRLIQECPVAAVAGTVPEEALAYKIALAACPELSGKKCIAVEMPMTRDREKLRVCHRAAAACLETILDGGEDICFLTLGDVTLYSSFAYLQDILLADGFSVVTVSGISSVSAAAACLGMPLAIGDVPLSIIPGTQLTAEILRQPGTCVIMKAGRRIKELKGLLRESGKTVCAVENCGMPTEKIYRSCEEIPDDAGYFCLLIAGDAV